MWIVRIAFRNLLRQRRRTVLTGLMVTVGYLLCSLSLGLGKGTYASIIEFFTSYRTGHVQIHARGYRDAPSLYATVDRWREIGKRLEAVPEVIAWAPRVLAPALAFSDVGKTSGVQLFGLDPAQEAATTTLPRRLLRGKWLADGEADNRVLVDEGLARLLRLEVGSAVYLIGEGADGSIANDVFEVIGIVQGAGGFAERNVYLPLPAAQRFLVLGDRVHELVLRTRKPEEAPRLANRLETLLNDPALEIAPWQVIEEDFYRAMAADMKGNWISQGIIMLIVGVGILNTVLMALLERTREYAVLRALGTRPGVLVRMILWEVLFLATLGVGVGFLLSLAGNAWFASVGMALPEGIEYGGMPFERMYGSLSPQVFWAPALLTWTTAALVGLFPALRAARIRPAEGLRAT